jgi:hypothetical protein
MVNAKYKDYIELNSEFVPVFSDGIDRKNPGIWKSFYPHQTFNEIVECLFKALEMRRTEDRKSIWVVGAYGTGKTFASFVLKHILEDDLDDVKEFIVKNSMQSNFIPRLEAIRDSGKVLVVHRSASSDITGDNMFFNILQTSVRKILVQNGCSYMGGKTSYDNILDILKNENSPFNFKIVFNTHRNYFSEFASPQDVISFLEMKGPELSAELLERISEVMIKSNFNYASSVSDIREWISDIIKGNNLKAIVFIWDEFSDFFKLNPTVTGFQEITQFSETIPFYFVLITHRNVDQLIHELGTRKKLEARFSNKVISMPEFTAIELISRAIGTVPKVQDDWEEIKVSLWDSVKKAETLISRNTSEVNITSALKKLLPLHPYASYILTTFSQAVSSNQRTMFQFLEEESRNGNFQWFIENNSIEDWPLMTADYLWDYFFQLDNVDFDENIRNKISYFQINEKQCANEIELKIFKATMLLEAMQWKVGGRHSLLKPTLSNISAVFSGTPAADKVRMTLDKLVQNHVLNSVKEDVEDILYIVASTDISSTELQKLQTEIAASITFEKIISDPTYPIYKGFELSGYLEVRFNIHHFSCNNFRKVYELQNHEPNIIPLALIYAKTESDLAKIDQLIQHDKSDEYVLINTGLPLMEREWNEFITQRAYAKHYADRGDSDREKFHKQSASNILERWRQRLEVTQMKVYAPENFERVFVGSSQFIRVLEDINLKNFPLGVENIIDNDILFKTSGYSDKAVKMGMNKEHVTTFYKYIKDKLEDSGIWNNEHYWQNYSNHPVSKMKIALENFIEKKFDEGKPVGVYELWEVLSKKPFGLMRCIISAFLFGFLMKEYANGNYYKYDEYNSVELTYEGLADIINLTVRDDQKAENQFIIKMKPEHKQLCETLCSIFKLPPNNNALNSLRLDIRNYLRDANLPLWAARSYIHLLNELGEYELVNFNDLMNAIKLLSEFASPNNMQNEQAIADRICHILNVNQEFGMILKDIVSIDKLRDGMVAYIDSKKPELVEIIKSLGVDKPKLLSEMMDRLTGDSSWLWDSADFDALIEKIYEEYNLIDALNSIYTLPVNSFEKALNSASEILNSIRIPYVLFRDDCGEVKDVFDKLMYLTESKGESNLLNKVEIAELVRQKSFIFKDYLKNIINVFKNKAQIIIDCELDDGVCHELYKEMPTKVFNAGVEEYSDQLKAVYISKTNDQKFKDLLEKWRIISNTSTPSEWSKKHIIPILCLFDGWLANKARIFFDLINSRHAQSISASIIDEAIKFLENESIFGVLSDINKCNALFGNYVSGEYGPILEDVESLKKRLMDQLGDDVYNWYLRKSEIDKTVADYAFDLYKQNYYMKVYERINNLPAEKVKEYLKELIKNEPLIGVKILRN